MANPFLVLGGIAIGIITAGFGVLAVPGWVASAQDAAAQNDLGNAVAAQSSAVSQTGKAATTLSALKNGQGLRFEESNGSSLETHSNGANWGLLATSASGAVFGKVGGYGEVFRGADRAALLSDPAFKSAWNGAGLPPLAESGGAEADGASFFRQYVSNFSGTVTTYAMNGTQWGEIQIRNNATVSYDEETGVTTYRPTVTATVNGKSVGVEENYIYADNAELAALTTSGTIGRAWAAAGLPPLDLSKGFNSDFARADLTFDYTDEAGKNIYTGWALSALALQVGTGQLNGEVDYGFAVLRGASSGAAGAGTMTQPSGYTVAVVNVGDGNWKSYTADSYDQLTTDPAFTQALSSAGLSL